MKKNGNMLDSVRPVGFVDIEMTDSDGKVVYKETRHNTITETGKRVMSSYFSNNFVSMSGNMFGVTRIETDMSGVYNNRPYFYDDNCLGVALLHLGDDKNSLSASSNGVNLLENDGIVIDSKLVGYASSNLNPLANGKEGKLDYIEPTVMLDDGAYSNRWLFEAGVATGTIDVIALMPMDSIDSNCMGIRVSRCLDRVNRQNTNFVSMSTALMPPGVPGMTADDEILLNFSTDGVSQWKYKISTGEMTEVTSNFQVINNLIDYIVYNNYTYMLSYYSGNLAEITVYDNNFSQVAQFSINVNTDSARFLVYSNQLWVTCFKSSSYALVKLTGGTNYYTGATSYADYTQLGITLPTGFDCANCSLCSVGDKFALLRLASRTHGEISGVIFTSMTDILNTVEVVSGVCRLNNRTMVKYINNQYLTLEIGESINDTVSNTNNINGTADSYVNNNNSTSTNGRTSDGGVYLSLGKWSNMLSYIIPATALSKTDNMQLKVTYGYKVV